MQDQTANRDLFEEQVEIVFKAFNEESFRHEGKHYTLPPRVPYRGYELEEIALAPRPVNLPVERWRPVVSANPRGLDLALGENLTIGIFFYLADTKEQAVREMTPLYEEHVKIFAPLGFVPGISPEGVQAASRRGGWYENGVPRLEHFMDLGAWFAGTAEELVERLKQLEERYPGMEHINLSTSMGTPTAQMLEQFDRVARDVMPAFGHQG